MSKQRSLHGSLDKFYKKSPDVVAKRLVALDTGGGGGPGGGIPLEPQDGNIYARSNGSWVLVEVLEAPSTGQIHGRMDRTWQVIPPGGPGGGIGEAPETGQYFCRRNADWEELPPYPPAPDLDPFVLLDGSRAMTGELILSGPPGDPASATNREYVDREISDAIDAIPPYVETDPLSLKLTGGTLSGDLTINTQGPASATLEVIGGTTSDTAGARVRLLNGALDSGVTLEMRPGTGGEQELGFTIHKEVLGSDVIILHAPAAHDQVEIMRPITLSGDPIDNDELTRKEWVENQIAAIPAIDVTDLLPRDGSRPMIGSLILARDPFEDLEAASKAYVDRLITGQLHLVGAMDATTGICRFIPTFGPEGLLPPAGPTNVGAYVIVEIAGTPTDGPVQIPLNVGDWVVSDGTAWNRLAVGGAVATAATVSLNPQVFGRNNVQDALGDSEAELRLKIDRAGDEMEGPLTLAGAPTLDLHACSKLYADTVAELKVNRAGDTMLGPLSVPAPTLGPHATSRTYVDAGDTTSLTAAQARILRAGDSMTGPLSVLAPTADLHATTRLFVTTADNLRALKAGDTFTGSVILQYTAPIVRLNSVGTNRATLSFGNATQDHFHIYRNAGDGLLGLAAIDTTGTVRDVLNIGRANGVLTFLIPPVVPTPTAGNQAANRDYADSAATQAASNRVLRSGDTVTGDLNLTSDGTGIIVNGGGRYYKAAGTGLVIRKSSGGQQIQIEDNNGQNRTPIMVQADGDARYLRLIGGTLTGGLAFGSATSTGPRELSRHLALWGTGISAYGFSITVDRLNVVAGGAAGSRIAFYAGAATTPTAEISTSGVHVTAAPTVNEHLCNKAYVDARPGGVGPWQALTGASGFNSVNLRVRWIHGPTISIEIQGRIDSPANWNGLLTNVATLPVGMRPTVAGLSFIVFALINPDNAANRRTGRFYIQPNIGQVNLELLGGLTPGPVVDFYCNGIIAPLN